MAIGRIEPINGVLIVKAMTAAAGLTHSGPQTVDGIACVAGDLVFDKDNATGSTQGPWLIQTGAWTQLDPGMSDGLLIDVQQGTANADKTFKVTSSTVWGTDTPTLVDQTGGTTGGMVSLTGVQELTNKTLTAMVVKTGLTASGSASNDFSASTGAFKTSTGAGTLSGDTTIAAGKHLACAAGAGNLDWLLSTGAIKLGAATATIGLYGVTAVPRAAAYVQTAYSTALRTVPADTAHAITNSSGGTPSTSALAAQGVAVAASGCAGGATPTAGQVDTAIASLASAINTELATIRNNIATVNAERTLTAADALATKQLVTSLIDDSQAIGIAQ